MKSTEHKSFVPYEISSQRLIEELTQTVGFTPNPEKYFKKTPKGYLIHTSFSWVQVVVGMIFLVFILLLLRGLSITLMTDTGLQDWYQQREPIIRNEFLAINCVVILVGMLILTTRRVSYLDQVNRCIRVTTSVMFLNNTRVITRNEIENIRLKRYLRNPQDAALLFFSFGERRRNIWSSDLSQVLKEAADIRRATAEPGDMRSFWAISIQKRNKKPVPLTISLFSDSALSGSEIRSKGKDYITQARDAWVLAFSLGVPVHFIAEDIDVVIHSIKDVPEPTEQESDSIYEKQEALKEQSRVSLDESFPFMVFMIILGIILLIYLFYHDIVDEIRNKEMPLAIIGLIIPIVSLICVFVYFMNKRSNGKLK